jgi:histidyl-tRNA synthetase
MAISVPKGVFDILQQEEGHKDYWKDSHVWAYVEGVIREVARCYGFAEIRTPTFERTELFTRSVGETSDIVTKEMYTFEDKGNRSMTLRPEGTASVMRSVIENSMYASSSLLKLFYIGPMFRYERPQAGRFRQHHQFGCEVIGGGTPEHDVETIDFLYAVYKRLGLKDLSLRINSVGDAESRKAYHAAFKTYLEPYYDELSSDSQVRFTMNPLRILDSKDARDREILVDAPRISEYLSDVAREHFSAVCDLLDVMGIECTIDPFLVRGLDYYNKTVFEVVAGELGAQNSIGGGGRYDGLIKELGGPDLPTVGFGTGIERMIKTMIGQGVDIPARSVPRCYFIPLGDVAKRECVSMVKMLRDRGIIAEMDLSGRKLKHVMKHASGIGAEHVVILGDDELEKGVVPVKNMASREEHAVALEALVDHISGL